MSNPTVRPRNIYGVADGATSYMSGTAATAAQNGRDVATDGYRGVSVVVDITNIHAVTPALTFTVQGKDPVSGSYYTLLASAALGSVATTRLADYPGCVAQANLVANVPLPEFIRVIVTVGDTDACTYTVSVQLLP